MTFKIKLFVVTLLFFVSHALIAQKNWPRTIKTEKDTVITLFQPQHQSLKGNILSSRIVVSVKKSRKEEPVFGVIWVESILNSDLNTRKVTLEGIKITEVKAPSTAKPEKIARFKSVIEKEVPKWNLVTSIDELAATIEESQSAKSDALNTQVPEIIYTDKLTTLISIDGEPIFKRNERVKMEKIANTPFLIIKEPSDNHFYLYAGISWYTSATLDKGWENITFLPKPISDVKTLLEMRELEKKDKIEKAKNVRTPQVNIKEEQMIAPPTEIIVKTKTAELLQSDGVAQFAAIEGTGLSYVSNSPDNIFRVDADQQYYVVLSGRWFKSASLKGPWSFVASDKLPSGFAKIPAGSMKDIVLANVAGTREAEAAVQESTIPQTAKVDRKKAKCTVSFDGEPKFVKIEGTDIEWAVNASVTILLSESNYYALDNGVWFISSDVRGPWEVSEKRPQNMDKIPPQSPVYNTRFVFIYGITPDYVYVGYTPGYTGSFVDGSTIVYGTGYPYEPWNGSVYYPYPVTYGYGMTYNPVAGWNMAIGYSMGFFSANMTYGCYWGAPGRYPPYYHYPPYAASKSKQNQLVADRNLYSQRTGISTRDVSYAKGGDEAQELNTPVAKKESNNMYSDKDGNVYRKNEKGKWEQISENGWQENKAQSQDELEKSLKMRSDGYHREYNYYNSMSGPNAHSAQLYYGVYFYGVSF